MTQPYPLTAARSPLVIAQDIGFGNFKAVWSNPLHPEPWKSECVYPSSAVLEAGGPAARAAAGLGGGVNAVKIEVDGKTFSVGPDASVAGAVTPILSEDYCKRPEYEALIAGGLHYAMAGLGKAFRSYDCLVLGLPVSTFADLSDSLETTGKKARKVPLPAHLIDPSQVEQGPEGVRALTSMTTLAKQVLVVPQPLGAFRYAQELGNTGAGPEGFGPFGDDEVILFIDPGYNTLDWLTFRGGVMERNGCGAFNGGVSAIYGAVAKAAARRMNAGVIPIRHVERAMTKFKALNGTQAASDVVLRSGNHKLPISELISYAEGQAGTIVDRLLQAIDLDQITPDRIIIAGGGSDLYEAAFRKATTSYPVFTLPDPVMANARGFWLLGQDLYEGGQQ
jgi:plasmid segregation protein ParM